MKVNLYERKAAPGVWTIDYRPHGVKGERVRRHFSSYGEAAAAKAELEGVRSTTAHPRLREVVAEYLAWCEDPSQGGMSAATTKGKRRRMEHYIIPALGGYRVRELSQLILDGYTRGLRKCTALLDLQHIKAFANWMIKRRYAEPLTWVPERPEYRAKIKRLPTNEDIVTLINSLHSERHRMICYMMLLTGMRWNEVKHLRWENYGDGAILLDVTKTDVDEVVTIPAPCLEWFERNRKLEGYVFAFRGRKTPPAKPANILIKAAKATGIKMSPHMFRHASATALYDLTEDLYAVQHHLRHANIKTTQIYTRYSQVRRKASVTALSNAFKVDKVQNSQTTDNAGESDIVPNPGRK